MTCELERQGTKVWVSKSRQCLHWDPREAKGVWQSVASSSILRRFWWSFGLLARRRWCNGCYGCGQGSTYSLDSHGKGAAHPNPTLGQLLLNEILCLLILFMSKSLREIHVAEQQSVVILHLRLVATVTGRLPTPFFHVWDVVAGQHDVVCWRNLLQGNESAIAWNVLSSLILFLPHPLLEFPDLLQSTRLQLGQSARSSVSPNLGNLFPASCSTCSEPGEVHFRSCKEIRM